MATTIKDAHAGVGTLTDLVETLGLQRYDRHAGQATWAVAVLIGGLCTITSTLIEYTGTDAADPYAIAAGIIGVIAVAVLEVRRIQAIREAEQRASPCDIAVAGLAELGGVQHLPVQTARWNASKGLLLDSRDQQMLEFVSDQLEAWYQAAIGDGPAARREVFDALAPEYTGTYAQLEAVARSLA
jgi:hypothetical protein